MRKRFRLMLAFFTGLFLLLFINTSAQVYNGNLILESQHDVNLFNYTEVTGNLTVEEITSGDITNLNGLSELVSVGGKFDIRSNSALPNTTGLSNLTYVGGNMVIYQNEALTNIDGLSSLNNVVANLIIQSNDALANIDGLINLNSVGGISIIANDILTNIDGLSGISEVVGSISILGNIVLTSVDGLSDLNSVGGDLAFHDNYTLTNLDGLLNLESVGGDFIINNIGLSDIDALLDLVTVGGNLLVSSFGGDQINGLINLNSIGGYLSISFNSALTNIDGLSGLSSVGGPVFIVSNPVLTNVDPLSNFSFFSGLAIVGNHALTSIPLDNLTSVGQDLNIQDNDALLNLDGFSTLTSVGGDLKISDNDALANTFGLSNINSIGGGLRISNNGALFEIEGLTNVSSLGGDLYISDNPLLANIDQLENLSSIGGSLFILNNSSLPFVPLSNLISIGDSITISNNASLTVIDLSAVNTIPDDLAIKNNAVLVNIDGLSALNSVGKNLTLSSNASLANVDGLVNLLSIGGDLDISDNSVLSGIAGLINVLSIGGNLIVGQNTNLNNINGLASLTSVAALAINNNNALANIDALSNLISISGGLAIYNNDALTNINGLSGITSVEYLNIGSNEALANINGLSNLTSVTGALSILSNNSLTEFCGLYPLLNSNGLGGTYAVSGNGANPTQQQIISSCAAPACSGPVITNVSTNSGATAIVHSLTAVPADALLVMSTTNNTNEPPYDCIVSSTPSLTWTKRVDAGAAGSNNAEIWTAAFAAGGNISVTSNWGAGSQTSVLYTVTGAEVVLGGASGTGTLQSAPSVSVTTTRENTILFGCTSDWNGINGATRVLRDGATERYYFRNPAKGYTTYYYTKATTTTGSYTEGISSPTGQKAATAILEIRCAGTPDNIPPTISSVSPLNNATNVPVNITVSAVFSEVMNAATVSGSTFELRNASNILIAATVTYTAGTNTATLTPTSVLAYSTVYTAKITGGAAGVKDAAGNPMATDYTWSFTTATSAPATYTIFPSSSVPATPAGNGGPALEVGVKFRVTQAGYITGIRFYKGAANTGTHTGHLWSSTGTNLATATFTGETASGWQEVLFTSPVAVSPGITYVASYFSPNGYYAFTNPYFTSALVNGPLRALANGEDGGNGVYIYSAISAFPNNTFGSSNYWVDVVFSTTGTDNTPPTITSVSPLNGATGVTVNTTVSAVFSEAMNAATISGTTFELRNSANVLISATVTYNAGTSAATLTPSAALAYSTVYTAKVVGGAGGVKDATGNAMTSDYSWLFTTADPAPATYTIFPPASVPTTPAGSGGPALEVGVKFRVTQAGYITGIRFYKGAANTGTHTGHLWSSTGTNLATATFTGETASGWQEVLFSSPVAVNPGITYVASYFSPNGYYAVTNPYFTSAVVNGPLRALANGEDGGNGVYIYSATSSFPNSTFGSSNYWVDVVFTTTAPHTRLMTMQKPTAEKTSLQKLVVNVSPNPAANFFKLIVMSDDKAPARISISDISGRVLERYEKVAAGSLTEIGRSLKGGTYFAEVIQGDQRKVVKIIKVN